MTVSQQDIRLAARDLWEGALSWRLWGTLGWQEIRQRYRRSVIGPFWLSIGMLVHVLAIGLVWSTLFKLNVEEFIPYLTIGALVWFFLADTFREGSSCLITGAYLIKQMRRPYSLHLYLTIWRNFLVFSHNFVVFILVALFYGVVPSSMVVFMPLAMILVFASISWAVMLLSVLSARFRDVPLVVANLLTVLFFVTPVMWKPEQLGEHAYIASLNPLSHLIDLIRLPLVGGYPSYGSWLVALTMTAMGWSITFLFFAKFRRRISYWL